MKLFSVTISFYVGNSDTLTILTVKRKADKASDAMSVVTSLVGSLSNYKDSNGNTEISVYSVSATLITE